MNSTEYQDGIKLMRRAIDILDSVYTECMKERERTSQPLAA